MPWDALNLCDSTKEPSPRANQSLVVIDFATWDLKQSQVDLFTQKKKERKKKKAAKGKEGRKERKKIQIIGKGKQTNMNYSSSESVSPMSYTHKVRSVVIIQHTLEMWTLVKPMEVIATPLILK